MPRVIPSGTSDPMIWLQKEKEANDALARLYLMMAMRREDRREAARERERMRGLTNDEWYRREQFRHDLRTPAEPPPGPNIFKGGQSSSNAPPQQPPAAPAAPGPAFTHKPIPGSVTPYIGPNPDKFSANEPPANTAMAQAYDVEDDDVLPTSAQQAQYQAPQSTQGPQGQTPVVVQPRAPGSVQAPRTGVGGVRNPNALPRVPKKAPKEGEYLYVNQYWVDKMAAAEKQYNLSPGTLMTMYGFENGGGRDMGQNSKSSAYGLFQWTNDLRRDYGITREQSMDPNIMIPLAARNIRDTANVLEKQYGVKLDGRPEHLPFFTWMHQFGRGDGSRFVRTYMENPTTPAVSVMARVRLADGTIRNNFKTLAINGLSPHATVGQLFNEHVKIITPWMTKHFQNEANNVYNRPESDEGAAPQGAVATGDAISYLQSRGGNTRGINPQFAARLAHVLQIAERETGTTAKVGELARSSATQAQYYANYTGKAVPWGGKIYYPQKQGGLAAKPGESRHQPGDAGDIPDSPVLRWLRANRRVTDAAGLEFLKSPTDIVHIQLKRGQLPPLPAGAPTATAAPQQQPQQQQQQGPLVHPTTGKPMIRNADGSFSTENTITVPYQGKWYNIPTIVDGKQLTPEAAARLALDGKNNPVGVFNSQQEAEAAAVARSKELGAALQKQQATAQAAPTQTPQAPQAPVAKPSNVSGIPGQKGSFDLTPPFMFQGKPYDSVSTFNPLSGTSVLSAPANPATARGTKGAAPTAPPAATPAPVEQIPLPRGRPSGAPQAPPMAPNLSMPMPPLSGAPGMTPENAPWPPSPVDTDVPLPRARPGYEPGPPSPSDITGDSDPNAPQPLTDEQNLQLEQRTPHDYPPAPYDQPSPQYQPAASDSDVAEAQLDPSYADVASLPSTDDMDKLQQAALGAGVGGLGDVGTGLEKPSPHALPPGAPTTPTIPVEPPPRPAVTAMFGRERHQQQAALDEYNRQYGAPPGAEQRLVERLKQVPSTVDRGLRVVEDQVGGVIGGIPGRLNEMAQEASPRLYSDLSNKMIITPEVRREIARSIFGGGRELEQGGSMPGGVLAALRDKFQQFQTARQQQPTAPQGDEQTVEPSQEPPQVAQTQMPPWMQGGTAQVQPSQGFRDEQTMPAGAPSTTGTIPAWLLERAQSWFSGAGRKGAEAAQSDATGNKLEGFYKWLLQNRDKALDQYYQPKRVKTKSFTPEQPKAPPGPPPEPPDPLIIPPRGNSSAPAFGGNAVDYTQKGTPGQPAIPPPPKTGAGATGATGPKPGTVRRVIVNGQEMFITPDDLPGSPPPQQQYDEDQIVQP